jgi:hypothetical protein
MPNGKLYAALIATSVVGLTFTGSSDAVAQTASGIFDQMGPVIDCARGDCEKLDRQNRAWEQIAPGYEAETYRQGISGSIRRQGLERQYNTEAIQLRSQGEQWERAADDAEAAGDEEGADEMRGKAQQLYDQADEYED